VVKYRQSMVDRKLISQKNGADSKGGRGTFLLLEKCQVFAEFILSRTKNPE
jgi:hypothetical protein